MDLQAARRAVVAAIPAQWRETAVAYLDEIPFRAGETVPVGSNPEVTTRPIYLGFIDCKAGKNWAHTCLYVQCGVDDDTIEITEGGLPPRLAAGHRRLTVQLAGDMVPSWAVLGGP